MHAKEQEARVERGDADQRQTVEQLPGRCWQPRWRLLPPAHWLPLQAWEQPQGQALLLLRVPARPQGPWALLSQQQCLYQAP